MNDDYTLPGDAPDGDPAAPDDGRDHFVGCALHALHAAVADLAAIGFSLDELAAIVARAFQPAPHESPAVNPAPAPF